MKNTFNLSEIFKTAWSYLRNNLFQTFSEALAAAWKRAKIIAKLRAGVVYFNYRKANGQIREAIGTLRQGNYHYQPKTTEKRTIAADIVRYYDLEKRAFRAFRIERFISVI